MLGGRPLLPRGPVPTDGSWSSSKVSARSIDALSACVRPKLEPCSTSTSGRCETTGVFGPRRHLSRPSTAAASAADLSGGETLASGLFLPAGRAPRPHVMVSAAGSGSATAAAPSPQNTAPGSAGSTARHAGMEAPYIYLPNGQRVHSMHEQGFEAIQSLSTWAETDLIRLLKPVQSCWQPSDLLPDSASPDFYDQASLRHTMPILPSHGFIASTLPFLLINITCVPHRSASSAAPPRSCRRTT